MDFYRWAGRVVCAALLLSEPALAEAPPPPEPSGRAVTEAATSSDATSRDAPPPVRLDPVEVIDRRIPEERLPSPEDEPTGFGTTLRRSAYLGERLEARDLLLHAPGTTVRHLPGGSTLALRGASPDQTLVFLDGIRLTSAAGGGLDLQTIPLSLQIGRAHV